MGRLLSCIMQRFFSSGDVVIMNWVDLEVGFSMSGQNHVIGKDKYEKGVRGFVGIKWGGEGKGSAYQTNSVRPWPEYTDHMWPPPFLPTTPYLWTLYESFLKSSLSFFRRHVCTMRLGGHFKLDYSYKVLVI